MDEYTPSRAELREAWVSSYAIDGQLSTTMIAQAGAEFERAWAEHDREIAERASSLRRPGKANRLR